MKLFALALSFSLLSAFAQKTPDELLNELSTETNDFVAYMNATENPEDTQIRKAIRHIRQLGTELENHPDASESHLKQALLFPFAAVSRATENCGCFFGLLKTMEKKILETLPQDKDTTAYVEAAVIRHEFIKPLADLNQFTQRMHQYASKYPSKMTGAWMFIFYAKRAKSKDNRELAIKALDSGLTVYPNHLAISDTLAMFRMVGTEARLSGPQLDGQELSLQSYRGKVVLVEFWASWCGPSKKLTPKLKAIYEKYKAEGLEVIGFSLDNSADALKQYLAKAPVPWKQIYVPEFAERTKLTKGFKVVSIPTAFVVSRQGKFFDVGLHTAEEIEKAIKIALKR